VPSPSRGYRPTLLMVRHKRTCYDTRNEAIRADRRAAAVAAPRHARHNEEGMRTDLSIDDRINVSHGCAENST
jgi:hypothetical protein